MIILLMGVSGAGKTTVGELLAKQLGFAYIEGDSFHSAANIGKMRSGIPLTDDDRLPWLQEMAKSIDIWIAKEKNVVLSCSALKQSYRDLLIKNKPVKLVYLKGPIDLISSRVEKRTGHFMPQSLLQSQFDALEEPTDAITVDVSSSPSEIVKEIRQRIDR
jgi:gluconokinase